MQFNRYIALPKSSLFNHKLFLIFRFLLLIAVGVYLYLAIIKNQRILLEMGSAKLSWHANDSLLLVLTLLLLPVNWLLEGLKWRIIAGDANLNLIKATKAVVLGLTLDNVLPAGAGGISGRVITLSKEHRLRVVPGILIGQVIQSIITFIFGLYGFWLVWIRASALFSWQLKHSLALLAIGLIITFSMIFWRSKIKNFLAPLLDYSIRAWGVIFTYSLSRYLVFLLQFIFLSMIFAPDIDLAVIFGCATWVFAARTFMPKISNLERLGIRILAVIFFMDLFNMSSAGVLASVIILWFINLVIPSLFGLTFLRNLKFETTAK
jgi:hypothetical protein